MDVEALMFQLPGLGVWTRGEASDIDNETPMKGTSEISEEELQYGSGTCFQSLQHLPAYHMVVLGSLRIFHTVL